MNLQKQFEKAQNYRNNGQIEDSVILYSEVRKIALEKKDKQLATECLHMIGVAYYQIEKFADAEKFLNESIKILHKVGNKGHEGISRVKLGKVLADQNKFTEAYTEINIGIKLLEKTKDKFFLSSAYLDRARVDAQKSLQILDSFAKKDEFLERRKCIKNFL